MSPELVLEEIADAILDGIPVDWSTVDLNGEASDEALVEQLKTLEALRLSRTSDTRKPAGTWCWGHLEVFERIGQGAYGDVYRGWDTRLAREVALKLMSADLPSAAPSDSVVIEEGRLLARVRHPNVVTIYGAERIDGRVGLWMEFIKGRTLEQALRGGRTFTAAEVTRLGVELCRAVSAVHAAGLLHRDIKTQNVMLDDSGRIVLMDFGTGRELDDAADVRIAGTPLYLAPEVLAGRPASARSDVYCIGVVLFRLFTNTYPVSGHSLADLRRAHAAGGDAGARVDHPQIPPRLRRVIASAIDPDPKRRHESAAALAAALERVLAPKRRLPLFAAAATLVAIVAGGWNLGVREVLGPALVALGVVTKTPTIAVLPFRNAGSDPGNDDFIDGLTSEVIRDLASLDGLQVRSQTSSFYFKDRPRDLRDVAKLLNVDLVVEATVQRAGNRLRINAQLVRIPGEVLLWSEPFDRAFADIFEIQDEISRRIVNKLRVTLGQGQRRYRTNPAAYELYLRGRALAAQGGTAKAAESAKIFDQVIAMDAAFAPAHAGLAEAYAAWSWQPSGLSNEQGIAAMRPAALRAIDLDPMLPEAHAAMGVTYAREENWQRARDAFEHALSLPPFVSQIQVSYAGTTLFPLGEAARAEELLADAIVRDPLSLAVRRELAIAQFVGGRYASAVANLQEVVAKNPTYFGTNNLLARALTQAGRPAEAIALFESRPENREWERWLLPAYIMAGRREDVDRLVAANKDEIPHRQAIIFAALGDKDRTFEALDRAIDTVPQRVAFMLVCPDMALLRGDPRLDALKKRLNLQ